jgi:molybdopterin/thiamine biosynthesis adenylyltransferase
VASAGESVDTWRTHAGAALWIADGLAGALPPCPHCAADARTQPAIPADLVALRDALLGTVVATETVKTLLAIGTPLAGRVLAYDPATATVASAAAASRPDCACARA